MVSFSYNFLTSATGGDGRDFAFITLQLGTADPLFRQLASVRDAAAPSNSATFNFETGTRTGQFPAITQGGTYTLGFGVTDASDDVVGSGLLIDNVQVNAVPEPSTFAMIAGGLGLLVFGQRAHRRAGKRL